MRIVIAPDSYKGCMTAAQVAEAMARGARRLFPDAELDLVPMADGGEGTVQALVDATGGRLVRAQVAGPLGGSVEACFGLAQALGIRFIDARGGELAPGGGALPDLDRIDMSGLDPRLGECAITVACDVDNPLTGPRGAARVFGPQKGATLRRGVEIVAEAVRLEERLAAADLCLTGEGGTDFQTVRGKTPMGVARAAKVHGVPVICLSGGLGREYRQVYEVGIDAVLSIVPGPIDLAEALQRGPELVEDATERALRLVALGRRFNGSTT